MRPRTSGRRMVWTSSSGEDVCISAARRGAATIAAPIMMSPAISRAIGVSLTARSGKRDQSDHGGRGDDERLRHFPESPEYADGDESDQRGGDVDDRAFREDDDGAR